MSGAAVLASRGAQRSGAGYVRLSTPGGQPDRVPVEVVVTDLPAEGWASDVLDGVERFKALVVGPGLGADRSAADVVRLGTEAAVPIVIDGDGLNALASRQDVALPATAILTPHEGEYERLAGHPPGPDRIEAARSLAGRIGAVVLLKGPTTVVASPAGDVLVVTAGDARLATAGTGDVLSGIIGALCAGGVPPFEAAAAGAFLHGQAGNLGWRRGLVAGDLPDLVPAVIDHLPES
jgi:NAD(P)H-hydrate epimerase